MKHTKVIRLNSKLAVLIAPKLSLGFGFINTTHFYLLHGGFSFHINLWKIQISFNQE